MTDEELRTLLYIYLNPEFDTEEEINENLKEAGIDAEQFTKDILAKIEKLKAQQKLNKGKQFKEDFYKRLNESELTNADIEELAFGYRDKQGSFTEEEQKELDEDKKKLALLKKIKGGNGSNNNNQ
jgi:hypothetical protein